MGIFLFQAMPSHANFHLKSFHLILQTNPKFPIKLPNPHTPIISNHTHEPLSHIPDVVVIVQELDVFLYCFCCWVSVPEFLS